MSESTKTNLMGMTREELAGFFVAHGEKPFRAVQVLKWIHQRGITDFAAMTDLTKGLRIWLSEHAEVSAPEIVMTQAARDGTHKWLLRLDDGNCIETVFIPEEGRGTLCVSSQVGCALDCTFCSTARQGFNRNLTAAEIIGQLHAARRHLQPEEGQSRVVSNVVLMGMGEPLLNFEPVVAAMSLMLEDNAYGLSKRRVTISTAGVVPALDRLRETGLQVALALSLHAPNDPLRDQLVPLNRKYPIAEVLAACRRYVGKGGHHSRVTVEYVLLDGVNDSQAQARELAVLLQDVPCKINLIPFNPFPESRYRRSTGAAIDKFRDILVQAGYTTITRRPRGDDIDAACGQLVGRVEDRSRRELRFARLENSPGAAPP
ncbi:23S rRNA (adenine(2503)-C(2))-methyltransferase RlmN [Ectothiorhodospira lacustris]|uniref:23S rRNA (adenine(2503)-C(2))-methyltransferase RlmN n=1 Tax=Ectothiorhodospira lacustris TaxID=2899127 RepID=UPI001EE7B672|nr:23S rRNA (adenine(2503)-C(2))-methyltransferase RlmN [Ectothiorhodospira lacustris]MCG5499793.1 23S rRNA (adenine(2503)-C(2))-methyltransferase RlmN [Ectothiorhodospira lacustris]MCG5510512.1 23S rRNA (adenine(2503)-C(2))-methyltransferase RlmN [Ectothiorhodospira lacustris]MCG5522258.1 23S rRNA (adenine(2503)-C(2))-methyltransferase RlmN [Ectothiorhodospira lacustris]